MPSTGRLTHRVVIAAAKRDSGIAWRTNPPSTLHRPR